MEAWYVVYTHPKEEGRAAVHLVNQGFTVFLPRCKAVRKHARKTETVIVPLFPRYLFIKMDITASRWGRINSTRGVQYIIQSGHKPLTVPAAVIENIQSQTDVKGIVPFSCLSFFTKGKVVEVLKGAFEGCKGIFEELGENERVKLLLDFLGRQIQVYVPSHVVRAA